MFPRLLRASRAAWPVPSMPSRALSARHMASTSSATAAAPSPAQVSHPDTGAHPNTAAQVAHDSKYLLKLYGQPDLYFTHGDGCYLVDQAGRRYLDLNAGIAVNALGHNNPAVVDAISDQAKRLIHLSNLYRNEYAGELAEMLVRAVGKQGKFEADGAKVFFCNSGTEANEAAFKFARKYGKSRKAAHPKHEFLSFGNAFHGRTMGALSATPNPKYQEPFLPLIPGFVTIPLNDFARAEELISDSTCGVIVEPVQGEGGINIADEGFLSFIRQKCDEKEALLIFDEIQAGLGRTGKIFSYQNHPSVTPDIITIAKPLANGLPIGAVIVAPHVAEVIKPGDHGTTFGGSPFATRVGKVVLSTIQDPNFLARVTETGAYFVGRLRDLAKESSSVEQVRGLGLIIGMQLKDGVDPNVFVGLARERGVLVITASGNTVRMVPPLVITRQQVDDAVDVFAQVLRIMEQ